MPVYLEHTASIEATVLRFVVCEECECEFIYELEVSGSGKADSTIFYSGKAPDKARQQAKKEFKEGLKYGCRPLPCPQCGHYQKHMISQAKWDKAGNIIFLAIVIGIGLLLTGIVIATSTQFKIVGGIFAIAGLLSGAGLGGYGAWLHSNFDPNSLPEDERRQIAEEHSFPRAEFENQFRDQAAKDYKKLCQKIDAGKDSKLKVEGHFFADPDQVDQECRLKAELPNGEAIRVQLKRKMKTGEKFAYEQGYKGHTIRFDYQLMVYTETKEK